MFNRSLFFRDAAIATDVLPSAGTSSSLVDERPA